MEIKRDYTKSGTESPDKGKKTEENSKSANANKSDYEQRGELDYSGPQTESEKKQSRYDISNFQLK